jgi:hypothetical protein
VFATPADRYDELMTSGDLERRPKGPKPIVGWDATSSSGSGSVSGTEGGAGAQGDEGTAPAASREAWKWKGVPPGRNYLYPVEPGKPRHYLAFDRPGPKLVELPPAWPTDDAEGDG